MVTGSSSGQLHTQATEEDSATPQFHIPQEEISVSLNYVHLIYFKILHLQTSLPKEVEVHASFMLL